MDFLKVQRFCFLVFQALPERQKHGKSFVKVEYGLGEQFHVVSCFFLETKTFLYFVFSLETDEDGFSNIPLINGSCIFRNNDPHVISFYNDLEIREEYVEFPPDSTIVSRYVFNQFLIKYLNKSYILR